MHSATVPVKLPFIHSKLQQAYRIHAYDLIEMGLALTTLFLLPFSLIFCKSNKGSVPCPVDVAQVRAHVCMIVCLLDSLCEPLSC